MTGQTHFTRLLVAVDASDAGRTAARFAAQLANKLGSELIILTVVPSGPGTSGNRGAEPAFPDMLGAELLAGFPALAVELASAQGIAQVEIPRFAERIKAGLIVLGRKPRSRTARLILGDTADAVVRRSRLPCLLVPTGLLPARRMLIALDGTDRGLGVLRTAADLALKGALEVSAVSVEPGEELFVSPRSEALGLVVDQVLRGEKEGRSDAVATSTLRISHGEPVEQVLAQIAETGAEILVTGFHPGGPLLAADERSISRRLVQLAPCAVLTVPL